jgi:hypothetical protein
MGIVRLPLSTIKPSTNARHTAATPTAFGTVMNYVALRLLGMSADEGPMTEIRGLIHKMGGATTVPTWGKVWLSVLGVYEWSGVNPVPPELWSLPDWVPFTQEGGGFMYEPSLLRYHIYPRSNSSLHLHRSLMH